MSFEHWLAFAAASRALPLAAARRTIRTSAVQRAVDRAGGSPPIGAGLVTAA